MKSQCIFLLIFTLLFTGCLDESFKPKSIEAETSQPSTKTPSDPPHLVPPVDPSSNYSPAIMAVGQQGSSMYTCDGGETWKGYRESSSQRCYDPDDGNLDCNHQAEAAKGVTWGKHGFLVTYGWGQPGQVEMTSDGETWNIVQSGTTWAGVAYGNGVYFLNGRRPLISGNAGETWEDGGQLNFIPYNARQVYFIDQPESKTFLSTADSGGVSDLLISRDGGLSFHRPTNLPETCGTGDLTYNNSTILLFSTDLCISNDNGETWQIAPSKPSGETPLYDGKNFKIFDTGVMRSSKDGLNWQDSPLNLSGVTSSGLKLGMVVYHPDIGRYVSIYQEWRKWYENTKYYYSDDSINWIEVNKATGNAPTAPHPRNYMAAGYIKNCE